MINSLGQPDVVLLVGGSSDIAAATAAQLVTRPGLLVLAAARPSPRRDAVVARLEALGARVETVDLDTRDVPATVGVLESLFDRFEVDVAVVAAAVLPQQQALEAHPAAAAEVCTTNYTAAVATGLVLARRMQEQGHGVVVALSSVAALRPRSGDYVYASSKAGFDSFYTGLAERLRGTGVRVIVVRPGFVHSAMTRGRVAAPMATTPHRVATAVLAAVAGRAGVVWAPSVLAPVMTLVTHLPAAVVRRLERRR